MPTGKAPLVGVAPAWCHERMLPEKVGDPESLLKWKRPGHPGPTDEQKERRRREIREELARYFAFKASTPPLTETEREQAIQKAKGHPEAIRDINSRVVAEWRQRKPEYKPRGRKWVDPHLVDPLKKLAGIYEEATGRFARTRDSLDPESTTEFPFYDWIAHEFDVHRQGQLKRLRGRRVMSAFESWLWATPPARTIRDILQRHEPKK